MQSARLGQHESAGLPDSAELAARLREDLLLASFTFGQVAERLGESALAGLSRNSSFAAADALGRSDDLQAEAIRLFALGQGIPVGSPLPRAMQSWSALAQAGLVAKADGRWHCPIDVKPYAWGGREGWVCSDHVALDVPPGAPGEDFVLGVSPASTTLAQLTVRRPVGRALDLGTGCGVQCLHLSDHAAHTVATDVNARALRLAALTLELSGVDAELRQGSLYEPTPEEFDLIVANPPFVMAPPESSRLVYREAGEPGDHLMRRVVREGAARLAPEGTLQVLGNWAVVAGQPWEERLAGWLDQLGCDALVLRRESLDVYEYIEVWLADEGLVGTAQYGRKYRQWKQYFDSLGIVEIGMGWVNLRRTGAADPLVRVEDWPHPVVQPVGAAIDLFFRNAAASALPDSELLASRLILDPDTRQEMVGRPGSPDPDQVVLRQPSGLCRAVGADTALAAVVGACDGDLPLGQLCRAVAGLLEQPEEEVIDQVVGQIRELLLQGFLAR
ncbi:MAG: methyltransferase [Propionibacteriaceae bacterium]|nr:methyltransferase [Propionibacteriaceae bacterium]